MNHLEEKQQGNIGVYMKEQTVVGGLKLWKALMLVLVRLYASMTQKTKELQSKI